MTTDVTFPFFRVMSRAEEEATKSAAGNVSVEGRMVMRLDVKLYCRRWGRRLYGFSLGVMKTGDRYMQFARYVNIRLWTIYEKSMSFMKRAKHTLLLRLKNLGRLD